MNVVVDVLSRMPEGEERACINIVPVAARKKK